MSHHHAVVWVDHAQAHVMHISPDDVEKSVVHPARPHQHLHHKRGSIGSGHAAEDKDYYHAIIEALSGAREILIVGPGKAKLALLRHAQGHDPEIGKLVVGIETVDHPTDGQLVAFARRYFLAKDQML